VQTVGLTWQHSFEAAAAVGALGCGLAFARQRPLRFAGAFLREAAIIGVLYGCWHLAGRVSVTDVSGAHARARWIERFEHHLLVPSERAVQHAVLGARYVIEAANLYYAAMHMTVMLLFLIWLFARHRTQYRPVRQVLAWTTLGCLLVQLMPVAPPRMLPGIVDTGMRYGQSVYSTGLAADQLSAMPSVHVAWAVLVGWYAWRISPSRWRYLGPAHAVITVFVVVVTGNHFWLDGIVAVLILAAVAWALRGGRAVWRGRLRPALQRPVRLLGGRSWRAAAQPPAAGTKSSAQVPAR
jgi:hypothetical protein